MLRNLRRLLANCERLAKIPIVRPILKLLRTGLERPYHAVACKRQKYRRRERGKKSASKIKRGKLKIFYFLFDILHMKVYFPGRSKK